jgi:hypothetical protein
MTDRWHATLRKAVPPLVVALVLGGASFTWRLLERVSALEGDRSKWGALADHENRLRALEPRVGLHDLVITGWVRGLSGPHEPTTAGMEDGSEPASAVEPEALAEQWTKGK